MDHGQSRRQKAIMLATTKAVAQQRPSGRLSTAPAYGARPEAAAMGGLGGSSSTLRSFGQARLRARLVVIHTHRHGQTASGPNELLLFLFGNGLLFADFGSPSGRFGFG